MEKFNKMTFQNLYKLNIIVNISNLRVVSMIPGDLTVAGCFNISDYFGGFKWKIL